MKNGKRSDPTRGLKLGILAKLLSGILIPLVLILTVIGLIMGKQTSDSTTEMLRENLTAQTVAASKAVDGYFREYFGMVQGLSSSRHITGVLSDKTVPSITTLPDYAEIMRELKDSQSKHSDTVVGVWAVSFATGELVQSSGVTLGPPAFDYTTRGWYSLAMDKQGTALTDPYQDAVTGEMVVTIVTPVYVNGQAIGIVGADLQIQSLIDTMSQFVIGESGYVTLLDSKDTVVYHPDNSLVLRSASELSYSQNMMDALSNDQNVDGVPYTRSGQPYYGSTLTLEDLNYQVLGILSKDEFDGKIMDTLKDLIMGFVLCAILLSVSSILLAISITRPLKRLNTVVGKLADGELDVEPPGHRKRRDQRPGPEYRPHRGPPEGVHRIH